MDDKDIKVLLIEDNPGDARLIAEALTEVREVPFNLEHAYNLSTGLEHLAKGDRDVVLLDLLLPDSEGFDTFIKARTQVPKVPIIVLTGLNDEALAIRMIREGAQDYLIKGYMDSGMLFRSIRYAIERKQVEEALRQSEERYRSLVETARDVIFTLSPDGTIASLNPIFETITGWSSTEWLGKCFSSIVHPDDLSFAIELFQHTLRGHTPPIFQLRVLSKSGEYLIAEFTATPQVQDGEVVGILGIARDITKQKKMEEELLNKKGSGLGLTVVYSIIKNHNGYVGLESQLGVGTRFSIYLPTSREEVQRRGESKKTYVVGKKRILVMDDEEMIRKLAEEALTYIGYEVEFARDGGEAIELYKKAKESDRPFDVVIMDLTIPGGMGGKEAVKRLLESESDVKAIASSGYSNDPVMSEFKKFGFKGVIPKPYNIEDLKETLYKVINEE